MIISKSIKQRKFFLKEGIPAEISPFLGRQVDGQLPMRRDPSPVLRQYGIPRSLGVPNREPSLDHEILFQQSLGVTNEPTAEAIHPSDLIEGALPIVQKKDFEATPRCIDLRRQYLDAIANRDMSLAKSIRLTIEEEKHLFANPPESIVNEIQPLESSTNSISWLRRIASKFVPWQRSGTSSKR
jgi:hypothetical protein